MIMIRTPLRMSFFGGGTDHPAWFRVYGPGSVLSTSIDKYVYITVRELPKIFDFRYRIVWRLVEQCNEIDEITHPVVREVLRHYAVDHARSYEIVYQADLPARAGLGSSSAFTVAALHALMMMNKGRVDRATLAREAIRVEQDLLREPVGSQDQVAAAFGGLNYITFDASGDILVDPVDISPRRREALNQSFLMFFTGYTRDAGAVEASKIKNFEGRRDQLSKIGALARQGRAILENPFCPLDDFGRLLDEAWHLKRELSEKVSNPFIDEIYREAMDAGALGGKLLGAGGGGFMLFHVPAAVRDDVTAAVLRTRTPQGRSPVLVPVRMGDTGSTVVLSQVGSAGLEDAIEPGFLAAFDPGLIPFDSDARRIAI